ncbi:MAG TPA: RNA polymerase sigma factor, partial [Acidimicrobiales bacterium]|nr:RNA polymerase sigma factor [Acidimicrobiales bacterium]
MAGYALPALSDEERVLASCRTGAPDGLDLLYREYAPALVAFCQHRLGSLSDAEDAAHEAILKAHRALPRFRDGARLWPWLATIAANICTDMLRARGRLDPEQDAIDFHSPEVDEHVSRRLRAAIVDTALDELPERFRIPLFLREFMGWSYEEIAVFSNKSIGSVRTTLMRSRRAFQARVEDVARRRGQWPLPIVVAGGWRRLRATLRSWRENVHRAGSDAANALWRAEGLLGGLGTAMQAAVVAMTAAGTLLAAGPAAAGALRLDGSNSVPAAASAAAGPGAASSTAAAMTPPAVSKAKAAAADEGSGAPQTEVTVRPFSNAPPQPAVTPDSGFLITHDADSFHVRSDVVSPATGATSQGGGFGGDCHIKGHD